MGPGRLGLLAWTLSPNAFTGTAPVAGTLQVARLNIKTCPVTIANLVVGVVAAGTTMTSGQNFAGLYSAAGALLGQTADMSTTWNSVGYKVMPLQAPVVYGQPWLYVAWYARATGLPQFARAGTLGNANFGLTGTNAIYGTANTALTTALPSTLGAITASDTQYFVAIS